MTSYLKFFVERLEPKTHDCRVFPVPDKKVGATTYNYHSFLSEWDLTTSSSHQGKEKECGLGRYTVDLPLLPVVGVFFAVRAVHSALLTMNGVSLFQYSK